MNDLDIRISFDKLNIDNKPDVSESYDKEDNIPILVERNKRWSKIKVGNIIDKIITEHEDLAGREKANQHPISAISSLQSYMSHYFVTDINVTADSDVVLVLERKRLDQQSSNPLLVAIPLASLNQAGVMPKESYKALIDALADIVRLKAQGGKYVGVSFDTVADLKAWAIPDDVNPGDFTFVEDDEDHEDARARYICYDDNGTKEFRFGYIIEYDPIGIATSEIAGIVKGCTVNDDGKVFVEADGTMSVVGWSTMKTTVGNKVDKVAGKGLSTNDFTTPEKNKLASLFNYDDTDVRGLIADEVSARTGAVATLTTGLEAEATERSNDVDDLQSQLDTEIEARNSDVETLSAEIDTKVDKIAGKGLSEADYTNTEKTKLASLSNYNDTNIKSMIAEEATTRAAADTALRSDLNREVNNRLAAERGIIDALSIEQQAREYGYDILDGKIDTKVTKDGAKVLSTNDYTNEEKSKLAGLFNYNDSPLATRVGALETNVSSLQTTTNNKVDKIDGKGLSTNDFTTAEKDKLASLSNYNDSSLAGRVTAIEDEIDDINQDLEDKVDKVDGKELSSNDYTTSEKNKLASLFNYDDSDLSNRVTVTESSIATLQTTMGNKVDKIAGKGLSANDYTTAEKTKLAGLSNYNDTAITGRMTTAENNISSLQTAVGTKVDKITGKGLSTNDYTTTEKNKLASLSNYDDTDVTDRLDTAESSISSLQTGLGNKVDKVNGKGLSSNDYTNAEKTKLAGLSNYNDTALSGRVTTLEGTITNKVDKISDKGLSTNDYTDEEKTKLSGLSNYDDTSVRSLIAGKVDKIAGMGLSSNDFTTALKDKLNNLESPKFLGSFNSEADLISDYPNNGTGGLWATYIGTKIGCTADVIVNTVIHQYNYDGTAWSDMGVTGADLPEMIKEKYESNPNTNAYTDAEKTKLSGLSNYDDSALTTRMTTAEGKITTLTTTVGNKVDKITGKGLSANDYTNAEKTKLAGLSNYDDTDLSDRVTATEGSISSLTATVNNKVDKVNGKGLSSNDYTNAEKTKLAGLSNYDDTTINDKITTLTSRVTTAEGNISSLATTVSNKVDKITGKGLSTNDYTTADKNKLAGLSNYNDTALTGRVTDLEDEVDTINDTLGTKVDKVSGKGLSTNDYTTAEKTKLAGLSNYDDTALNGRVTTAEGNISSLTTAVGTKVDKITGKGLSTNDYTTAEKTKLSGLSNYDDTALSGRVTTVESSVGTLAASIGNKVDKITGKGLSTNDYTTAEKTKLAGLSNYNDATLSNRVTAVENNVFTLSTTVSSKVDKITGKGLSTNDYTTAEKTKLQGLSNYDDTDVRGLISTEASARATKDTSLESAIAAEVTARTNAISTLTTAVGTKVDKITGKGLSTNDFTTTLLTKLNGIATGAQVNTVTSVASKTGAVALVKGDVGLGNVDNTSDANKPISTATQTALNGKVSSVSTANRVYVTDASGANTTLAVSDTVVSVNTVVKRGASGQINVPTTPTSTSHAASKQYVDTTVQDKFTLPANMVFGDTLIVNDGNVMSYVTGFKRVNVTSTGTKVTIDKYYRQVVIDARETFTIHLTQVACQPEEVISIFIRNSGNHEISVNFTFETGLIEQLAFIDGTASGDIAPNQMYEASLNPKKFNSLIYVRGIKK
jgi:hypothetical protein